MTPTTLVLLFAFALGPGDMVEILVPHPPALRIVDEKYHPLVGGTTEPHVSLSKIHCFDHVLHVWRTRARGTSFAEFFNPTGPLFKSLTRTFWNPNLESF